MTNRQIGIVVSIAVHTAAGVASTFAPGVFPSDWDNHPAQIQLPQGQGAVWMLPVTVVAEGPAADPQPEPNIEAPPAETTRRPQQTREAVDLPPTVRVEAADAWIAPTPQNVSPPTQMRTVAPSPPDLTVATVTLPPDVLRPPQRTPTEIAPTVQLRPAKEPGVEKGVELAHMPKPEYPAGCVRRGQEGLAVIEAMILPSGAATDLRVVQSTGFDRLDAAALKAVGDARFVPARRGGRPVRGSIRIPIRFVINDR